MSYREAVAAHLELTGVLRRLDRLLVNGQARERPERARAAQQLVEAVRQRALTLERPAGPDATDTDWTQGRRRGLQMALRIVLRSPDVAHANWLPDTRHALAAATRAVAEERAGKARDDTPKLMRA